MAESIACGIVRLGLIWAGLEIYLPHNVVLDKRLKAANIDTLIVTGLSAANTPTHPTNTAKSAARRMQTPV